MNDTNGHGGTRTTVVTHDGGVRFVAEVRGHRIATDQPMHAAGSDSAPTPLELIAASLGSCIALYLHAYLDARALPTAGLRVEVRPVMTSAPRRIGQLDARVELPAGVPDEHLERLERVAVSCPAHATLAHAPRIDVQLVSEGSRAGADTGRHPDPVEAADAR